ncbi:MAG: trypsin-like peptidase domain-containing protein, partial [Microthrixaceae bacterium]
GAEESTVDAPRTWQHPSEVGLAVRGRVDRRRSALIASGVVLGGLSLLLSGVLLGGMEEPGDTTSSTIPSDRAAQSIASVMITSDDTMSSATGVVLDDDGHVLVDAAAVDGATEIWARCADGELQPATVLGTDPGTDLSVLRMESGAGVPASIATAAPAAGADLQLVATQGATTTTLRSVVISGASDEPARLIDLRTLGAPVRFAAAPADATDEPLRGAMAFDRAGRLSGIVATDVDASSGTVAVLAAAEATEAAARLIAAHGE